MIRRSANDIVEYIIDSLYKYSSEYKESNDCAVMAVAVACNKHYRETHLCFQQRGRLCNDGTPWNITERVINSFRYHIKSATHLLNTNETINVFMNRMRRFNSNFFNSNSTYLIQTHEHIFTVHKGFMYDINTHFNTIINDIFVITPMNLLQRLWYKYKQYFGPKEKLLWS